MFRYVLEYIYLDYVDMKIMKKLQNTSFREKYVFNTKPGL